MKLVASALHVAVCPWFGSRKGLRFSKHFELAVDLDERIIANALTEPGSVPMCRPVFTNAFFHMAVKRPTRAVEELHHVAATRTERRLFAQVDFRHEMRPIAFVDPGTFIVQVTRASRLFDLVAQQFFDIADAVANVVQFLSDAQ